MFLKFQDRNNRFNLLLEEKKDVGNKTISKTVKNLGTFSDDLKINSNENRNLLRNLTKTVQKQDKQNFLNQSLDNTQLVELLNQQIKGPGINVNLGVLIIQKALEDFNLNEFFSELQNSTARDYSLYNYFSYILAHNIVHPGSLLYYFQTREEFSFYLGDSEIKKQDLYDFLTFFYPHRLEFQRRFFETLVKRLGKPKVQIFFYDGTNFTCWNSKADPDHLDRLDGEIREGLRKFGKAKSKRDDKPCVAMGIIATEEEWPLFYSVFPGNRQEITYIKDDIRQLNRSLAQLDLKMRILITADAGLHSGDLQYWLSGANNYVTRDTSGFIIGRGIGNVDEETKNWVLSSTDYYPLARGKNWRLKVKKGKRQVTKVKSRIITTEVDVKLKDGRKVKKRIRLKQIAIFSEKREYQAMKVLSKNLEKIQNLKKSPKKLKSFIKNKMGKYMDVLGIFTKTGELTEDFMALLNEKQIDEDIEKAGFFLIETSETDWPDGKIIRIYRDKYHIEHLIRSLKSIIEASPAYVYTYEHIISHYDLCALSLTVLNFIKERFTDFTGFKFSSGQIQFLLQKFNAILFNPGIVIIADTYHDTQSLMKTFGIEIPQPFETNCSLKKKFGLN